jgi:tRNA threonylcarbamoyladenosine biosynthesis protein TsaE
MDGEPAVSAFLADEDATLRLAARMARALVPRAAPLVLYLSGELGAGKTTLARGLLQALGERGPVRSPTYALVAEYEPPGHRVLHLDLYRLNDPDELAALGLADQLAGSTLWLIEWPQRAAGAGLPPADAWVIFAPEGAGRRVRIEPTSAAGREWAAAVAQDSG